MKHFTILVGIFVFIFISNHSYSQTVTGPNAGFFCPDLEGSGGDHDLLGIRLKDLNNTDGANELYVGSGDLGQVNNANGDRSETGYVWQPTQYVVFTLDGVTGVTTLDVGGTIVNYSDGITDNPNGLGIEDISRVCLAIRQGNSGGMVTISNFQINGETIGGGAFGPTNDMHWIISDICLGTPETHTITFDLALSGNLLGAERTKVEVLLGSLDDNDCGLIPDQPIPTLSQWGIIILGLFMFISAGLYFKSRENKLTIKQM